MAEQKSDSELVEACLKNDKSAQKLLFDTYAKQMVGLCYRYINDYDKAHDIMQEGFIKVFLKLASYRGESALKLWIRKIMVNTCLETIRKEKNHNKIELVEAENLADDGAVYHDFLETELIMSAVKQLPVMMRTVLNMFAIDGYSYKEIAIHLGIEESTVRSNIHRSRKQLSEILKSSNNY